jgi:hypothetical protein
MKEEVCPPHGGWEAEEKGRKGPESQMPHHGYATEDLTFFSQAPPPKDSIASHV